MKSENPRRLPRATELAHRFISECLEPEDFSIDATAGNGHDTLFLAGRAGAMGGVFAFDVQPEAIAATRARLEAANLADRVALFQQCHSRLGEVVEVDVKAAMFNLGYLPGGDKRKITTTATTLQALEEALVRLVSGGRITVVVYPGHPGGDAEAAAVDHWAAGLDQGAYGVASYGFLNQAKAPPRLVVIERRDG